MTDISGDKNYIENLLKALPVNEAIDLFAEIDDRIVQLLKCSSEDFLSLNDHFKNYHKESKNLVKSASEIIQLITDSKISNTFSNLKKYCDSFSSLTNLFTQHVEFLDVEIKKTTNKFESLNIVHNNFKQNILSLKLLLANFKVGDNSDELGKIFKSIEYKIENEKALVQKTDIYIEQFVNIAQESYIMLSNIKKENYQHLQKLNDNIEVGFALFRKKYDEASKLFPALKELTDKNASNIAKIITNLQYHDIIRQKIEHIQRTHKDIVNDLRSFSDDDNSAILLHNKAKTFLKIRDVAGLQAAQLLHANKQYQMAIEEIGSNLEEIGNEMVTISSLCENLVGKSAQTKDYYLNNIVENLDNALNYNNKLSNFISTIKQHTQALSDKNHDFSDLYNQIHVEFLNIKQQFLTIFNSPEIKMNNSTLIEELLDLINETETQASHIGEIHNELAGKVEKLVNPKENFSDETNMLNSLYDLGRTIPGLIELLKISIQSIDEHLYFNTNTSLNVSDNIKNSIKKINYYDVFEKSCDKTIQELNSINLKLNHGSGLETVNRNENLKHLKDRYTMASEHLIHDQLTNITDISELSSKKAEQIINLADQNSESDDENLELF